MERGPMALFGAIVAVGLGPALWMGVQLGAVQESPVQPPAVSEQRAEQAGQELLGGTGAGAAADDTPVTGTRPRSDARPLTTSPSAKPSPSASSSSPTPSPTSTSVTTEPEPTTDGPTTPPTESTTEPTTGPTGTTEPPVEDETGYPTLPPEDDPDEDEPTYADPAPYGHGNRGDYVAAGR
ncbi:hypothetical protein [Actinoplanes sp. URMC 104]|uniref:hypothetical protein n=1 Tax=Actinoplanes sp. URMC 104 TaxID=3423409 RepID=UPI003F1A8A9C